MTPVDVTTCDSVHVGRGVHQGVCEGGPCVVECVWLWLGPKVFLRRAPALRDLPH